MHERLKLLTVGAESGACSSIGWAVCNSQGGMDAEGVVEGNQLHWDPEWWLHPRAARENHDCHPRLPRNVSHASNMWHVILTIWESHSPCALSAFELCCFSNPTVYGSHTVSQLKSKSTIACKTQAYLCQHCFLHTRVTFENALVIEQVWIVWTSSLYHSDHDGS